MNIATKLKKLVEKGYREEELKTFSDKKINELYEGDKWWMELMKND